MKKTKSDPTGQAKNRRTANTKLKAKLNKISSFVKAKFRTIPRTSSQITVVVNQSITVFDYSISAEDQAQINKEIRAFINVELLGTAAGDTLIGDWFWTEDVALPYRQGVIAESGEFNDLVAAAILAGVLVGGLPPKKLSVEEIFRSARFKTKLDGEILNSFNAIKALADNTSTDLLRILNEGVVNGSKPSDIGKGIDGRISKAKSSAKRTSDTDINRTYNNALMDTDDQSFALTGLRSVVIHISALIPTTRPPHAARHGNAYTVTQQRQWWDTGSNRINCHCSTLPALVDENGNLVDPQTRAIIKAERRFFDE
jgi:hypothetical protein